jgi:sigma-E factor negative regulatory protein RseA
MNDDERSSQVSALFDGELPAAEGELVLRRVLKDAELAKAWSRYAAIGAVVRNEPLARRSRGGPDIAARVMASLDAEAAHVAPASPPPATVPAGRTWFTRGAAGAAIAAGVAALSLLVVRTQAPAPGADPASLVAAAVTPAAATGSPEVGGSAPDAAGPAVVQVATRASAPDSRVDLSPVGQAVSAPLVGYVVAHSEYATPAVRFSPLSTVMMVDVDPTVGTVETTEAEARARR